VHIGDFALTRREVMHVTALEEGSRRIPYKAANKLTFGIHWLEVAIA
jgi:hypothetical protein